jgi:hypothetical protein
MEIHGREEHKNRKGIVIFIVVPAFYRGFARFRLR